MTGLFTRRDIAQYTDSLARYVPGGPLFAAKGIEGSRFRALLRGMAAELFRANGYLKSYNDEILPDQTDMFLDEWEKALGIPDTCFPGTGSNERRRRDILTKLAALGVQTVDDFEQLADTFGIDAEVIPGKESGLTFGSDKEARFTIVINLTLPERFTYTFPIPFGDGTVNLLKCIFEHLKPANCQIIFQEV